MSTSSSIIIEDSDDDGLAKDGLLWDWATHSSKSFHNFSKEEATEIRSSLLNWYRHNRRMLPWRGDPGPFDGSTAGINSKIQKSRKRKRENEAVDDTKQKNLQYYFKAKGTKKAKEKTPSKNASMNNKVKIEPINEAIPVTGYGVWVSEIMLQQTRVEAVIPYYLKWMRSFPTVEVLARASEDEVNAHWAGLGFYRRARLLHKGSKYVMNNLNGIVPETVDELLLIDGIGRYTASAISSIAFDRCVPVVDGNVCRVLSRLKGIANNIKAPILKDKVGWELADQIVQAGDKKHAGEVNQALMELGATYCAPSGTGIDEKDPLRDFYLSTKIGKEINSLMESGEYEDINKFIFDASQVRSGRHCELCEENGISDAIIKISDTLRSNTTKSTVNSPSEGAVAGHDGFPLPPMKKPKREEILAVFALSTSKNNSNNNNEVMWLMIKRPKKGLLAGQWEFPNKCLWNSADERNSTRKQKGIGVIELPSIALEERQQALDELDALFSSLGVYQECSKKSVWLEKDLTHIFSHVRHTMNVQYSNLDLHKADISCESFTSTDGREIRWMGENDMKNVGITSGVKKVLAAVKLCCQAGVST